MRTYKNQLSSEFTINIRAKQTQRDLIDHAAQIQGKSRSEFMLESAYQKAQEVLLEQCFFGLDEVKFADHNLRGHAVVLSGTILNSRWLDWVLIRFITFDEIGLPINSDDRVVWQLAQSNQMILLTANRSMKGDNSLE